ncbi:MAG: hypothetical protein HYY36_01515 [Gammaproteobacteria bacterium]|nr:hypothetical protein [Gammaproteobacteria bacterium]
MTQAVQMPLPFCRAWPVGLRLRFKLDANLRPRHAYLRGTPVLILSPLTFHPEPNDWRQYVAAFGARYAEHRFGWARPDQLEVIPGQWDDPALQVGEETELRDWIRVPSPIESCPML